MQLIKKISEIIKGTEFENKTFIAGGYVRDLILGRKNDDIDLVVEMNNGGVKLAKFLHRIGASSVPVIYKNFGTALINIDGYKVELVMTRSESYRDRNRKPEVQYATLLQDVMRRDFTINSLLQNICTGEIIDLSGKGMDDLRDRIIRATDDPVIIFREDPLRILRAVRFANRLDFSIEPETEKYIKEHGSELQYISQERKREELEKILLSNRPADGIRLLFKLDLIDYLIPELREIENLEQNNYHCYDALEHSLQVLDKTKATIELRLAALLHDIGKKRTYSKDKHIHFYNHEKTGAEMCKEILDR
ncbi:MAG: CCA tRNA nucleotidyltransferase, partial [Candidatus Cloacimonetes bacterium]|nr:CCA tRNA nucleotidyltransferase [Candidatus Cloacimonadota bacterium]